MFYLLNVTLMVYVNIASVCIYCVLFYISYTGNGVLFLDMAIMEILFHLSMATICVGWQSGFYLYVFAVIPCVFYCDYLDRKLFCKIQHVTPCVLSGISILTFLGLYYWTVHHFPLYWIEDSNITACMFFVNAFITFSFLILFLINYENITKRSEGILEHLAMVDDLTQIYNRRKIMEMTNQYYEDCVNLQCQEMAVAILDIDDFKAVNDTYGHGAGDYILKEVSKQIAHVSDQDISYGRWGGEEFLVVAHGDVAYQKLQTVLLDLKHLIETEIFYYGDNQIRITVTAGATRYHNDRNVDRLLSRADSYLYQGKMNGKNCLISDTTGR